MTVYLDVLIILNFFFDFLILLFVSIILKRNIKISKIFIGSLVGSITIFILFIKISNMNLIIFKLILSILINIITFGYKDFKYTFNNILYFYSTSIILGGTLYLLSLELNIKNLYLNLIIIILLVPITLFIYLKEIKKLKNVYSINYLVNIYLFDNKKYILNGILDTGNKILDPYKKRKVIIVNDKKFNKYLKGNFLLVPYNTINSCGILKCIKAKKVEVVGLGTFENILIGINNKNNKMEGVNCILNSYMIDNEK